MRKLTKESAERIVHDNIGKNKTIILDGKATLGKCAAFDYLVNQHGYIFTNHWLRRMPK